MSNPGQNREIAGSITYPEGGSAHIDHNVPQPRQPTNLQGLLRFAMEATQQEDAPGATTHLPMDAERRRFLEEALKSMTIDVIQMLQENVKLLQHADSLSVEADPEKYMTAFETILDSIDNVDTANDFHKIGGFMIFQPCFNSVHGCIRAGACDVLAELCQNNPYCQSVVTDNDMLRQLLDIVNTDPDDETRIKAVYAVSCNVRENQAGLRQFLQHKGVQSVLAAMQRPLDKLRTKCAFLLSCLSGLHVQVRDILLENEALPVLIALISESRRPSHEHLLSLLVGLVTDCPRAVEQCTEPRYNLKLILAEHLRQIQGEDAHQEEQAYCQLLLNTIFNGRHDQQESNNTDR